MQPGVSLRLQAPQVKRPAEDEKKLELFGPLFYTSFLGNPTYPFTLRTVTERRVDVGTYET